MFDNRCLIRKLFSPFPKICRRQIPFFHHSAPGRRGLTSDKQLDSAIVDYIDAEGAAMPRHIFRLCAMAEKPIPVGRPKQ